MKVSDFTADYSEYLSFFRGNLPTPRAANSYRGSRRNVGRANYRLGNGSATRKVWNRIQQDAAIVPKVSVSDLLANA